MPSFSFASPTYIATVNARSAPLASKSPSLSPISHPSETSWMYASLTLICVLLGAGTFHHLRLHQLRRQLRLEELKKQELKKKLKLALHTISKLEQNPDLVHSRDFNLEYLRMRMGEDTFNFAILNQIKVRIKDKLAAALRPKQAEQGTVGIASTGRQIDEIFDVEHIVGEGATRHQRILFRVQVRLVKLPTQATSQTIQQIIDCMEAFLSPQAEDEYWQPTIQGRLAHMEWDQKAKPTPLLVLEQTGDGTKVTFRTRKNVMTQSAA